MKINILIFLRFTVFVLLVWACNSKTEPTPEPTILDKSTLVKSYTKEKFVQEISALGNQSAQLVFFVRTGIKCYKISYKTKGTDGEDLIASGAVIVPTDLKDENLALVSIQHGTIFNESEAPSYFNFRTEAFLGSFFSSAGYIVAMPDYLGYGDSKEYPHPYENKNGLANPNIDFLRAVKQFIKAEKLKWNNNLMLTGYSEGGYATLATQKAIEENYSSEFNLKASSCGAGAYNKTLTMNSFLKNKTSGEENNNRSYMWVLDTYDRIYKIKRPLSSYYIEPYLTEITKTGYRTKIAKSFDTILNPSFVTGLTNGTDKQFLAAISDNDIFDWKPKTETRLFHGTSDTYVPILNSESAFAAMKAKGATNVTFTPIKNGTHTSAVSDYFLGTFELFNKNKNL